MRPCRQLAPGIYQENTDSELTELFRDYLIRMRTIYFMAENNFVVYQKCNKCTLIFTILNWYYPLTTRHSQTVPHVVSSCHDCDICVQKLRQSFLVHNEYRQDRHTQELPDDWPRCRDQQDDSSIEVESYFQIHAGYGRRATPTKCRQPLRLRRPDAETPPKNIFLLPPSSSHFTAWPQVAKSGIKRTNKKLNNFSP